MFFIFLLIEKTKIINFYLKKNYEKYNFLINKENLIKNKPLKKDFYEGIEKIKRIPKFFKCIITIKSLIATILSIFLLKEDNAIMIMNIIFEILICCICIHKSKENLEIIKINEMSNLRSSVTKFFKTIESDYFYKITGSEYNGHKEIRFSRKTKINQDSQQYVNLIIDKSAYEHMQISKYEEYIDLELLLKQSKTVEELIEKITFPNKRKDLNQLLKEVGEKIANIKR